MTAGADSASRMVVVPRVERSVDAYRRVEGRRRLGKRERDVVDDDVDHERHPSSVQGCRERFQVRRSARQLEKV